MEGSNAQNVIKSITTNNNVQQKPDPNTVVQSEDLQLVAARKYFINQLVPFSGRESLYNGRYYYHCSLKPGKIQGTDYNSVAELGQDLIQTAKDRSAVGEDNIWNSFTLKYDNEIHRATLIACNPDKMTCTFVVEKALNAVGSIVGNGTVSFKKRVNTDGVSGSADIQAPAVSNLGFSKLR